MAYYGGQRFSSPYGSPYTNPYGNTPRVSYVNQGYYGNPGGLGRQTVRQPAIVPQSQPQPQNNRMLILCMIISLVVLLVILGVVGAIVGIVLSNQDGDGGGTSNPQPTQAPQPQPTQAPQPQPTQAPQPQPTQAPQPQPTQAPVTIEGDIFNTGICGTQPALANRVLGGSNAQLGHWPWIGSLQLSGSHSCGATLLNERWAITAAHCFLDVIADGKTPPNTIVFGITNTNTPESGSQSTGFTTFNHPSYSPNPNSAEGNDITLLRLSQPVSFTNNISPVCLATLVEETTMYSNCQAAGWGALSDPQQGNAAYPDILQEVDLPLISPAACGVPNIIICAGQPQGVIDTCQGDSGGPLICENRVDDSWHLVGVVSGGVGCGLPNSPGFYTRVTQFQNWIQTTINQNP